MNTSLLYYYEAIERASSDMLAAAEVGDWNQVIKLEGVCVLLISQLREARKTQILSLEEARLRQELMRRILANDRVIQELAELHRTQLELMPSDGKPRTLH